MRSDTLDLGFLYALSERASVGLMLKNVYGVASADNFNLPKTASAGLAFTQGAFLFSIDSEFIFGEFGGVEKKTARFWFLRAGLDWELHPHWHARAGLIVPLVAKTSNLGDMMADIPDPKVGGTVGLGADFDSFSLDAALYGDPAKSYVEQEIVMSAAVTLSIKYQ